MYNKFNLHLTNKCNYHCKYCFGKFKGEFLPLKDAKKIVDNISYYFKSKGITNGTINLAGGEPLLYRELDKLIDYILKSGIRSSIVTNGYLLTPELINRMKGKVSCIGFSIDSLSQSTNIEIGRCCHMNTLSLSKCESLSKLIHSCGIKLKINTVVSRYNLEEDLLPLYQALRPDRIKFLQMHIVRGVNDRTSDKQVSKDEFLSFCKRYDRLKEQTVIITEESGQMENSYLMIDPCGKFLLNNNGEYTSYGNCLKEPLSKIISRTPLSRENFDSRYKGDNVND